MISINLGINIETWFVNFHVPTFLKLLHILIFEIETYFWNIPKLNQAKCILCYALWIICFSIHPELHQLTAAIRQNLTNENAVEWQNSLSLLLYCIQIALNVLMWSCVTLANKISDTSVSYPNYNNMAQFSKEYICTNPCSTLQHKSALNNFFFPWHKFM